MREMFGVWLAAAAASADRWCWCYVTASSSERWLIERVTEVCTCSRDRCVDVCLSLLRRVRTVLLHLPRLPALLLVRCSVLCTCSTHAHYSPSVVVMVSPHRVPSTGSNTRQTTEQQQQLSPQLGCSRRRCPTRCLSLSSRLVQLSPASHAHQHRHHGGLPACDTWQCTLCWKQQHNSCWLVSRHHVQYGDCGWALNSHRSVQSPIVWLLLRRAAATATACGGGVSLRAVPPVARLPSKSPPCRLADMDVPKGGSGVAGGCSCLYRLSRSPQLNLNACYRQWTSASAWSTMDERRAGGVRRATRRRVSSTSAGLIAASARCDLVRSFIARGAELQRRGAAFVIQCEGLYITVRRALRLSSLPAAQTERGIATG